MIFNSFQFIWLFPIIFLIYWLTSIINRSSYNGKRISNTILLLISYGLYAQWSIPYTFILFGITFCTYTFARLIEYKQAYGKKSILFGVAQF